MIWFVIPGKTGISGGKSALLPTGTPAFAGVTLVRAGGLIRG